MEVILREHVDNLGRARRGRQGRQRLRAQFPAAAQDRAGGDRGATSSRSSASGTPPRRAISRRRRRPRPTASGSTQTEVEIARRVGENNTLYGSVTSADIAQALVAKGFEIDKRKIQLPDPLKALGEVTVPVKVHREVTAQVKVTIVAAQR